MKKLRQVGARGSRGQRRWQRSAIETEGQKWLTREQMSVRLGVCIRTIDHWVEEGTLPCFKHGGVVRFDPDDCDAALRKFYRRSRWQSEDENQEETSL